MNVCTSHDLIISFTVHVNIRFRISIPQIPQILHLIKTFRASGHLCLLCEFNREEGDKVTFVRINGPATFVSYTSIMSCLLVSDKGPGIGGLAMAALLMRRFKPPAPIWALTVWKAHEMLSSLDWSANRWKHSWKNHYQQPEKHYKLPRSNEAQVKVLLRVFFCLLFSSGSQ